MRLRARIQAQIASKLGQPAVLFTFASERQPSRGLPVDDLPAVDFAASDVEEFDR